MCDCRRDEENWRANTLQPGGVGLDFDCESYSTGLVPKLYFP